MITFQFIASIVGSLAWPTSFVLVVLILRKPISQVILSLKKASYKGLLLECYLHELEGGVGLQKNKVEKIPQDLIEAGNNQTARNQDNKSHG
jgi:hypothetical protein